MNVKCPQITVIAFQPLRCYFSRLTMRGYKKWQIGPIRVSRVYFKLWKVFKMFSLKHFCEAEDRVHLE